MLWFKTRGVKPGPDPTSLVLEIEIHEIENADKVESTAAEIAKFFPPDQKVSISNIFGFLAYAWNLWGLVDKVRGLLKKK